MDTIKRKKNRLLLYSAVLSSIVVIFISVHSVDTPSSVLETEKKEEQHAQRLSIITSTGASVDFFIDTASTEASRTRGLSDKTNISSDYGLLFIFDTASQWGIWMKDMNFPIDIIWLDENKRIVDLQTSVSPDTFPRIFIPQAPARYVLEISAGVIEKNNIQIGDFASF